MAFGDTCEIVSDRAGYFRKNPWAKITQNGQKWPKNGGFSTILKNVIFDFY